MFLRESSERLIDFEEFERQDKRSKLYSYNEFIPLEINGVNLSFDRQGVIDLVRNLSQAHNRLVDELNVGVLSNKDEIENKMDDFRQVHEFLMHKLQYDNGNAEGVGN